LEEEMKRTQFGLAVVLVLSLTFVVVLVPTAFGGTSLAKGSITLSLWSSSQTLSELYASVVVPKFLEKYPEVKNVEVNYTPIADFVKKIAVSLPAGSASDILEIEDSWATPFVTAGYFAPNPSHLTSLIKNRMSPGLAQNLTFQGKTYGVPVSQFHELMYYNTDMLKAAGIAKIPERMDELVSAAVKLTKREASGKIDVSGFSMRLGGNPAGTTQKFWVLGLLPNGVNMWEESKKTPGKYHAAFNNEAGVKALRFYLDLLYKHRVDDFASLKDSEAFSKGKTAILMREPYVGFEVTQNGPDIKWTSAPMPRGSAQRATFLISLNHYVPKATTGVKQEYAFKFIELMLSPEIQETTVVKRANRSPLADFKYSGKLDPRMVPGFAFPADMKVYMVPMHNAYDLSQVKLGEALPAVFKKADLLNNLEGLKKEVEKLAELVNDAYRQFDEYAP
jgi:multiple sugar transport system substrate-binding protein